MSHLGRGLVQHAVTSYDSDAAACSRVRRIPRPRSRGSIGMLAPNTQSALGGVRQAAAWVLDRLREAADPDTLTPEFVTRLLLFRVVLLAFGLRLLDSSLEAALGNCGERWGMSSRAALAALIIPPLINLAGIIWPLLGMPSYERHFKPFQRLSVCTSALAHLLQSMLGLSWVQGTMTQYLLFDVFLLIINQDPMEELLPQLAFVQITYNVGLVLKQTLGGKSSLLAITTQYEFFVMVLLGVLALHKLYCSIIGPRDRLGMMKRQLRNFGSIGRHISRGNMQPHAPPQSHEWAPLNPFRLLDGLLRRAAFGAGAASCSIADGPKEGPFAAAAAAYPHGRLRSASNGGAPRPGTRLSSAYIWKFFVIKLMHGVHFYLWYASLAAAGGGDAPGGIGAADGYSAASTTAWSTAVYPQQPVLHAVVNATAAAGAAGSAGNPMAAAITASAGGAAGAYASIPAAGGFPVYGAVPAWRALGLPQRLVPSAMRFLAAAGVFNLWLTAMIAVFGGKLYAANIDLANWLGVVGCLASRLGLLIIDPHTDNKAVFHNMLLLGFSLLSHEDPHPMFAAQMGVLTVAFKCLSVVLSRRVPVQPLSLREVVLTGPEYYILLVAMVIIYPTSRVGRYAAVEEQVPARSDNSTGRRARLSSGNGGIPAPVPGHVSGPTGASAAPISRRRSRRLSALSGTSGPAVGGSGQELQGQQGQQGQQGLQGQGRQGQGQGQGQHSLLSMLPPGETEGLVLRERPPPHRSGTGGVRPDADTPRGVAGRARWSCSGAPSRAPRSGAVSDPEAGEGEGPERLSGGRRSAGAARRAALRSGNGGGGGSGNGRDSGGRGGGSSAAQRRGSGGPTCTSLSGTMHGSGSGGGGPVVTARISAASTSGTAAAAASGGEALDGQLGERMSVETGALAKSLGLSGGGTAAAAAAGALGTPFAMEPRTPIGASPPPALGAEEGAGKWAASSSPPRPVQVGPPSGSAAGQGPPSGASAASASSAAVVSLPRLQALRHSAGDSTPAAAAAASAAAAATPTGRFTAPSPSPSGGGGGVADAAFPLSGFATPGGASGGTPAMVTPRVSSMGSPCTAAAVAAAVAANSGMLARTRSTLSTMAAELSVRNSGARQARYLIKDRMLLIMELPLCSFLAWEPLAAAQWTTAGVMSATPAFLYWSSCVAHCAFAVIAPALATAHRTACWAVRLDTALLLLQLSRMLLGLTSGQLPPIRGLVLLCAKWGLVDLGDMLFFRTFPLKVLAFFMLHCYQLWSRHIADPSHGPWQWSTIATDALQFNLLPLAAFLVVRGLVVLGSSFNGQLNGMRPWVRHVTAYACVGGQGALALVIMLQSLPSLSEVQAQRWQTLAEWMQGLGFELLGSSALPTTLTVLAIVVVLCIVSSLQSIVFYITTHLGTPRQRWFAQSQAAVAGFVEALQQSPSSRTLEGVVEALKAASEPVFGTDLLVKLATIDTSADAGDASLVNLNILHWGYKHVKNGLQHRTMPLATLASIHWAVTKPAIAMTNDLLGVSPEEHVFEDWELHHHTFGARCFLVVPLIYCGHTLGALVVMGIKPNGIDSWLRRIVIELGKQVSSALYTVACHQEMEADKRIIADVYGTELVAEAIKRQARSRAERSLSQHERSLVTGRDSSKNSSQSGTGDDFAFGDAASGAGAGTMHGPHGSQSTPLMTIGGSPTGQHVLYKQWHPAVSVLFADIVGYTTLSKQLEPEEVMHMLHDLFCRFDALCTEHSVFKVETIGDCYMACTGLLVETDGHARQLVDFGRSMLEAASGVVNPLGGTLRIRVGIHSGRVMSGIVGSVRARYCLFGDTVNTASRMESTGLANAIQISDDTYRMLPDDYQQQFKQRGTIEVKGKGLMNTYFDDRVPDKILEVGQQEEEQELG